MLKGAPEGGLVNSLLASYQYEVSHSELAVFKFEVGWSDLARALSLDH